MNAISSILRIVFGLALIILSYTSWRRNSAHIEAGEPLQLFGITTGAAPWQITLMFVVMGLIGLWLIARGLLPLLKGRG
jgi:hypothetical protein